MSFTTRSGRSFGHNLPDDDVGDDDGNTPPGCQESKVSDVVIAEGVQSSTTDGVQTGGGMTQHFRSSNATNDDVTTVAVPGTGTSSAACNSGRGIAATRNPMFTVDGDSANLPTQSTTRISAPTTMIQQPTMMMAPTMMIPQPTTMMAPNQWNVPMNVDGRYYQPQPQVPQFEPYQSYATQVYDFNPRPLNDVFYPRPPADVVYPSPTQNGMMTTLDANYANNVTGSHPSMQFNGNVFHGNSNQPNVDANSNMVTQQPPPPSTLFETLRRRTVLDKFDIKSELPAEMWIALFEQVTRGLPDNERIELLVTYLSKDGLRWYAQFVLPFRMVYNWPTVRQLFLNKFARTDVKPIVASKDRKLQPKESIQSYFDEKTRLMELAFISRSGQLDLLTDGLPDHFRDAMISREPRSLIEWLRLAQSLDGG